MVMSATGLMVGSAIAIIRNRGMGFVMMIRDIIDNCAER